MTDKAEFMRKARVRKKRDCEIPESDIQKTYCDYAKSRDCNPLRIGFLFKKGWPDITTLCPGGRLFFIEFKRKGKEQSPLQVLVNRMLVRFGFTYFVCDEIGQAEKHLEEFLTLT